MIESENGRGGESAEGENVIEGRNRKTVGDEERTGGRREGDGAENGTMRGEY